MLSKAVAQVIACNYAIILHYLIVICLNLRDASDKGHGILNWNALPDWSPRWELKISKHRHLHAITFEYWALKKKFGSLGSIISEPLLRARITSNNSYV